MIADPDDYRTDYGTRADPWFELVVPVLRRMGATEVVRRTSPRWRRSIERTLKDGIRPKQKEREQALEAAAVEFVREHFASEEDLGTRDAVARFLNETAPAGNRLCACGCGRAVRSPRARWFSEACRKRANRRST